MKKILLSVLLLSLCSLVLSKENPPPGQGFIDVPGGPVWYRVAGNGPGIPLLVLHGGPGGTSCGYALLEPMGDTRPVVRYDQLGTGRSGRPEDPSLWEVEHFVEELDVIRKELGLEKMHLLGHSWGGSLAAAYVLAKGTQGIASVTLSSPLLSTPLWIADANYLRQQLPEDVQQVLTEHERAGTTDSKEYREATQVFYKRHIYAGERPEQSATCAGAPWSKVIYEHMWGPTEFYATGNLLDFDVTGRLHEIDVPVLLITGEFDEARPETVAKFQKLIPGSRFEIIQDAGHGTLSKNPDQYRQILREFFASVEAENH
jgi:proline-specific peptidase